MQLTASARRAWSRTSGERRQTRWWSWWSWFFVPGTLPLPGPSHASHALRLFHKPRASICQRIGPSAFRFRIGAWLFQRRLS
jgi:hypothetical protein